MQGEQRSEIDLKQAVRIAIQSVRDLYDAQGYQLADLLLEEVRREDNSWFVTVGFTGPRTSAAESVMSAVATVAPRRAFKRVKIDAKTGKFIEMQIRELSSSNPQTQ